MRNRGMLIGVLIAASLAIVAVAVVLWAEPADATITGKQLPPYGSDWVIDRDTTVLSERISLQGNISIEPGYKLYMKSVSLTFSSSSPGKHGINVKGSGKLEIEETTIKAETAADGWFFKVTGTLSIHDNVKLYNVQDGIKIFSDDVTIDDLELHAQGMYGLYIQQSDPSIKNSEIYAEATSDTAYGIYLTGDSGHLAAPTFDTVYVKTSRLDNWTRDSGWEWEYFYLYGLYADGADLGTLSNMDITFNETVQATFNYTGQPYLFVNFNAWGIYLTGPTTLDGFKNVRVIDGTYYADVDGENGVNAGTLYLESYFHGLYNQIWWDGSSPTTLSGLNITNQRMTSNGHGVFNSVYKYINGQAISWWPDNSGGSLTFSDLVIDQLEISRAFDLSSSWTLTVQKCEITANDIDYCIMDISWWSNDITFTGNKIANNTMDNNYYFYGYYMSGTFTLDGNNITGNTYYQFMYTYYNQGPIDITNNLFMRNKVSPNGAYVFFHFESLAGKLNMDGNNFTENSYRQFLYSPYPNQAINMINNEWDFNTGTDYMFYTYYIQGELTFKGNTMYNNSMNGGFYGAYNRQKFTIVRNHLSGNRIGTNAFLNSYGYNYAGFEVTNNLFENNDVGGSMFRFLGLGYWQTGGVTLTLEDNRFLNNTGTSATNNGLFYFLYIRQGFTVRNNYFENNSASCIVNYLPYTYGYAPYYSENDYHPKWWFYVESNTFVNNSGKCIAFTEIDNCNIQIKQNKAHGNKDYTVYVDTTRAYNYEYQYDPYLYMYGSVNGPDTLSIENNNISGNPGGGIYAKTSVYDSNYAYYSPGNPDQVISVKNNFLNDNGKDGWAIWLGGLYRKPTLKSNSFDGSLMGQYMELIGPEDGRRVEFAVEYRDVVMNGGKDGITAFGFGSGIEATFYYCSLLGYSQCLYAKDTTINAWWCAIPEAGGVTEGKGRIYVWNHLEIWVTWANATGVDSGYPVKHAVVSLRGHNGKYSGALVTDLNGKLAPMVVNPWTSIEGEMDQWSPYNATILAENASTPHEIHVVGEFVDPNPMRLTLWDIFIPEVIFANPQDGTLLADRDVLGEGFLFERASGIQIFEASTEMAPGVWVPVTPNVLWQHVFPGLTEGAHNLSVRAKDLSGNWNESTISIVVDLTDPVLQAHLEFLDGRMIPFDPVKGGYFVHDKEILINGTYSDNFAAPRDIIIRINGVPEQIFQSQLGKIYKRIKLDQGINTLIIDATDTAGRRTTVRLYVSLDSYAPTVYLYSPLQSEKTGNKTMLVTGLTEPDTQLEVLIQSTQGTRTFNAVSRADGTFSIEVELFEGIQKLLVTATDSAGNPTQLSRDVTLDTAAPDFVINQPPRSPIIVKDTKYTIICTMTKEADAETWIGGQKVPNTGVFKRTLVLQEGPNDIEIKAIDKVGNEQVKLVTIIRDTVKPVLVVTEPLGDYLLTRENVIHFSGTSQGADKTGGGVFVVHKGTAFPVTLVSGDWAGKVEWKYDLTLGPTDFDQFIDVKAVDVAGNEVVKTVQVVYDIIPPTLRVSEPAGSETVKVPRVNITGATDESVLVVYLNGIEFPVKDGLFSVVWPLTAGKNPIDILVKDDAGNNATLHYDVTYVPPAPPPPPKTNNNNLSSVYGWILIVAAATIVVTAFVITSGRAGRR